MEDLVKQRIREVISQKNTNITAVSRVLGLKQNTLSRQINGNTTMSADTLLSIIGLFPDVNFDWLLTGQGSMLRTAPSSSQHIQNRDGIVAGGSMIVPSHYAAQKIAEKKEGKLLEVKAELSGLKQENERLRMEVDRGKLEAEVFRSEIESLKKENAELHKLLIEEKERLISVLMERK